MTFIESVKFAAMFTLGIIGAFIFGTASAVLLACIVKLASMGWTHLFGEGAVSSVTFCIFGFFVVFSSLLWLVSREEVPSVS